ncbi:MAG: hypothetical protein ACTIJ6_05605 [Leucobacter sp.]
MSATPELMRQGTQRKGAGFSVGFISSTLRESSAGGGLVARFGISGEAGRSVVNLAAGESTPLPGGGSLNVIEIFVSPNGSETAAAILISERGETDV